MNPNVPQPIYDTLFAALHYTASNQISTHEMDGKQTLTIGGLATSRLRTLGMQIQFMKPSLNTYGVEYLPLCLSLVSTFASPFAHQYLAKPESERKLPLTVLSKITVKLGDAGDFVAKHSNKVINTACCVTYVAMIAFGFPVSGAIGLFGLFLILVKRQGMMPAFIDKRLEPITWIAALAADIVVPAPLLYRAFQGIGYSIIFSYYAVNNSLLKKILPDWFLYPIPGKHEYAKLDTASDIERKVNSHFKVNFSSIYTPEAGALFSSEMSKKLDALSMKEVFEQFEKAIGEKKETPACKRLKNGLVDGKYEDTRPVDDAIFQKTMKAILLSIMEDKDNFDMKVDELLDIVGKNCAEGWIREAPFLLDGRSKEDYKWAVHHELSNLRGNIMKQSLIDINRMIERINKSDDEQIKKLNLDALGGANGIHLVKAFEKAAWYRFRTDSGELYRKIDGISLLESLYLRFLHRDKTRKMNVFDGGYIGYQMATTHPGLAFFTTFFIHEIARLDARYGEGDGFGDLKVVDWIYDAIKPEGEHRKIQWTAIMKWIQDAGNRLEIEFYDEDGEPNSNYIAIDDYGRNYLTKKGVKLLLWDLGVIQPTNSRWLLS